MSVGRLIREIDTLSVKVETGERAAELVVQQALAARQLALIHSDAKTWWQEAAKYNLRAIERWRQIELSPNTFKRFAKERIVTIRDRLEEAEKKAK